MKSPVSCFTKMRSVGAALITLWVNREADGNDQGNRLLTFIGPSIANIFAEYNQQDTKFLNLFISVRRCTSFKQFFFSVHHQEIKTAQ